MPEQPINRISRRITQEASQGASQAMLYATGLTPEDMDKAQVGIASMWYEGNSCNMHLDQLAAATKEGVVAAGMVGMCSTPSGSRTGCRWAPTGCPSPCNPAT